MKTVTKILLVLTLALVPALVVHAQTKEAALSDAQKAAVESVVRDLLLKKEPELIIKAAQEVQTRVEKEQATKSNENISVNRNRIFNDPNAQIAGNPKGDVTVVEFFDYQCGYCKMVQPTVRKILENDKNIRFVFKELPILGPASHTAAIAALASAPQGKYQAFHDALMNKKEHLTDDVVFDVAESVGINVEKLKTEMRDEKYDRMVKDNIKLAGEIGANGTPAFVIGNRLYPGAMQYDQIVEIVAEARKAKK